VRLTALGVGPGHAVGLMLDRSFELVIAMLAIFKAGGAYLPCDPSYPDDRLTIYLEDGGAMVVLTQAEHVERAKTLSEGKLSVLNVADIEAGSFSASSSTVMQRAGLLDPAYVIFTSGSTGRPKGVVVTNVGLVDFTK